MAYGDERLFAYSLINIMLQKRDRLNDELLEFQERIDIAENEVAKYDTAFASIDQESDEAAQLAQRATADLGHAQDEKKELKSRFDEEMNERHEVQVCISP